MKTFVFTIFTVTLLTADLCLAQSFIDTTKIWSIVITDSGGGPSHGSKTTSYFKFTGDTTIKAKDYFVLYECNDVNRKIWRINSYWREKNDSVFQYNTTTGNEDLMYDFILTENDTFLVNEQITLYVDSVRMKEWGEKLRKHWYLSSSGFEQCGTTVWIEGVGNIDLFLLSTNCNLVGAITSLLCFTENNKLVFQNPEYNDCYINSEVPANNPSHEYQTVYSNRIALFENSEKQIKALRIDSVKADADSVFYPFATIQEVSKNCFSPYKASWIGEKVVVKPDGINLFFNREGDTITLKTRARIKETWIAFQRADNFRVKATVQSIELVNFLGLADSVKTITLTVTDLNENTVNHALNKLKVKISKTYGFIETLNFYLFPDITVRYPNDRLEVYSLVGLTNPKVGVQNLTWFEVNDFQVGDELHVQEHNLGDPYFFLPIREYDNRCIYKYLERTDYANSIVYRYARKQSIKTVYTDSTTFETYNDTLKSVVPANPGFDKLPAEPIIEDFSAYQLYMRNEEYRMKIDLSMIERYSGTGNCLSVITGEGCFYEKNYIDGLGGPYYYCSGYVGDTEERKLVYYKKGETEWGEKLVITGVSDIKTGDDLKVFPNPADNYITISNPSNIKIKKIELFDFSGRIVQLWNATECAGNTLNIQHISPGVYLLKAETDAGIKTEKLVVQ